MRKYLYLFLTITIAASLLFFSFNSISFIESNNNDSVAVSKTTEVTVPILMFHHIQNSSGGTWTITGDNFRSTLEFILEQGFTPISFNRLIGFVDGAADLPDKPVCINLDDGYYSNYEYVLPIVTELNVPITVFMICDAIRSDDVIPVTDQKELYMLSRLELEFMEASPLISIQNHSYGLHGVNMSYSLTERDNCMPLDNESEDDYKGMFNYDCEVSEQLLYSIGSEASMVFSYPCGKYNEWSEEVLKERGYRVSLTTDYGHRNLVVQGDSETLFLLGRMNVNDDTSRKDLLKYLERK